MPSELAYAALYGLVAVSVAGATILKWPGTPATAAIFGLLWPLTILAIGLVAFVYGLLTIIALWFRGLSRATDEIIKRR